MARPAAPYRRAVRTGLAVLSCLAVILGAQVATAPARATTINPYSPSAGHPYRHGAVPTREAAAKMRAWRAAQPAAGQNLNYGGGVDGIGVTTGAPKVYLIFWGSQWGTAGTDANGNTTLSGDSVGMAPRLQQLMKGLGVNGELWSGVTTQYCEGIASGSQSCPAGAAHVGYPNGGPLAGVWLDTGAAAPASATEHQLGVEAVTAASHFGNTTPALNRNAQYVVVSPHGTTPDGFNTVGGNFCAWHDWNGDTTLIGGPIPSTVGDIAFTNLPYVTDAGGSCGENFVNAGSAGVLDGVTIVEGHEYAETITDQNPAGGWTDSSGAENGDKCAWLSSGPGASANVPFATGSFAMQSTWANDATACEMSHPIVGGGGGNDFTIAVSPASGSATAGTPKTFTTTVSTAAAAGFAETVSFSVAGLPTGVTASFSPTSVVAGGTATLTLTTGTATPVGVYQLGVTGTAPSATRVASYSLAVVQRTGAIVNGTFETDLSGWTASGVTAVVTDPTHTGFGAAELGSSTPSRTSTLKQTFTVPSGQSHLELWYRNLCPDIVSLDWFTVTLRDNGSKKTVTLVPHTCDLQQSFQHVTATVKAGHSYTLTLTNVDDNYTGDATYTYVDDVRTY
jgi:serine protease